jgi:hypothetical protein
MSEPFDLQQLLALCDSLGLKLPQDELQRLLPGVNRSRKQVEELRALLDVTAEPAAKFVPPATGK